MMLQDGQKAKHTFAYKGGLHGFKSIIAQEGVVGLYRGYFASLLTSAPNNAVWWGTYQPVKREFIKLYKQWKGGAPGPALEQPTVVDSYPPIIHGAAGMVAAFFAASVSTPLDAVKTKLQTHNVARGKVPSLLELTKRTYAEGGLGAFYRGFAPRLLSMVPSSILLITAYEWCKERSVKSN